DRHRREAQPEDPAMKLAVAAVLVLAACGDDGSMMMTQTDAATQTDAQNQNQCLIPGSYGAVGSLTGTAGAMGGVTATFTLDAGPPRDTFFLKMVDGNGVFSAGITPGTYTI